MEAVATMRIVGKSVMVERIDDCWRRKGKSAGNATALAAGFGPENIGVGDPRIVTLNGNVEAIFKGELDGVLQSNLQLAVMNQLVDAGELTKSG